MSGPFKPAGPAPDREPEDPRRPPPPAEPTRASNTTWIVGVAAILLILYVTVNSITTDSPGSRGITDGDPLPAFAAPLALANLKCKDSDGHSDDCDSSVALKAHDGHPRACDIHVPNTFNSCDAAKQGPLALAFMVTVNKGCINEVDQLQKLAPRFPNVQFAAVAIRGDHSDLNDIIRRHHWTLPVAYDHDGAVANAFAVAICPTITFAYKGGKVEHTSLGETTDAEIIRHLKAIDGPT
jgi:hypothetical protein